MKRQNLRTVSLIVVTFTYLLIGAAIFGHLELDYETRQREHLDLIELIIRRKYNISDDDFSVLTTTVIKSVPHKAGIQWKFSGAFYFATTVVTTIGYGHSTPSTVAGRTFCMAYALIGIPLGLVMFQSIGERMNTFVAFALRHIKRCVRAKNPEVTQTNLVAVVSILSTVLMTSMAAVFAAYERWDYFDALYYCFITLTTIGFGDFVALQKDSALQAKPEYVALSLIFILFGLSVVSSAVNLLVLRFLTLNTEDEKRDEAIRFNAALNPIQLDGDIITSAGGKFETTRDDNSATDTDLPPSQRSSLSTHAFALDDFAGAAAAAASTAAAHRRKSNAAAAAASQATLRRRRHLKPTLQADAALPPPPPLAACACAAHLVHQHRWSPSCDARDNSSEMQPRSLSSSSAASMSSAGAASLRSSDGAVLESRPPPLTAFGGEPNASASLPSLRPTVMCVAAAATTAADAGEDVADVAGVARTHLPLVAHKPSCPLAAVQQSPHVFGGCRARLMAPCGHAPALCFKQVAAVAGCSKHSAAAAADCQRVSTAAPTSVAQQATSTAPTQAGDDDDDENKN